MENAGLRKSIEAGVYYFIVGQTRFFCERDLWKYAMLPLFFMVLFYLIFLGGTLMFICPRIAGFLAEGGRGLTGEHLPSLILHLFYGLAIFVIWATQNMLYQCFGAFIFDALSDCYEKRTFGYVYRHSLRRKCRANCESLLLSARNAVFGLGLLVLSILSFGVGAIICTLLTGYLLGVSYIQACAVNHGMGSVRFITRKLRSVSADMAFS